MNNLLVTLRYVLLLVLALELAGCKNSTPTDSGKGDKNNSHFILPPYHVAVTTPSGDRLTVKWLESDTLVIGFHIERRGGAATAWREIAQLPLKTRSFIDSGLSCNTRYTYRLNAITQDGTSNYSDTASGKTLERWWDPVASPTPYTLNDVAFPSDNIGYAVGTNGTITKTLNGGIGWNAIGGISSSSYFGVAFTNVNHGIIVGGSGLILTTDDGGATWTERASGTSASLQSVRMVDDSIGYVCGASGVVLKTVNGGKTWAKLITRMVAQLNAISFVDRNHGTIVGRNGVVIRTENGGLTWDQQQYDIISDIRFFGVAFTDSANGFAVGMDDQNQTAAVYRTMNGGAVWTAQTIGTMLEIDAIGFSDSQHGLLTGAAGLIMQTSDGGANWGRITLPGITPHFFGLHYGRSSGYIVGASGASIRLNICSQ